MAFLVEPDVLAAYGSSCTAGAVGSAGSCVQPTAASTCSTDVSNSSSAVAYCYSLAADCSVPSASPGSPGGSQPTCSHSLAAASAAAVAGAEAPCLLTAPAGDRSAELGCGSEDAVGSPAAEFTAACLAQ